MTSVEFETVDEFLEHFGTKGMRWGVRNAPSSSSGGNRPSSKTINRSSSGKIVSNKPEKKGLSRRQKRLLIGGGIALAGGALLAAGIIRNNRQATLKSIKATADFNRGIRQAQNSANLFGGIKVTDVRKGFAVGSSGVATPIMQRVVSL